ncbi:MAG: long-chain fatty acid--CoA ligase [Endomicrobium sp.]|jgi:acyl-coenzyme A synthetase/AMP-(fatty) acid ligase|nr:long-chain fatty acid--CoA ligase [Endomicrobium sp.]
MNISFILESIQKNKDIPAVITDEKTYLFADIYKEYLNAKQILTDNNIKSGSIVSVIADFNPKSIALIVALIEMDCILVPISATIKSIDSYIRISESAFVIDLSGGQIQITKTAKKPEHKMLLDLIQSKNPGLILFSSGTTGEPKAALHNLSTLLEKFKKPGKVMRTITFLLFDHIGGFNTLIHTVANGGTIVLIKSRDSDDVCRAIEKHKVELLPTSPTFLNLLLLNKMSEKYDLSSLKIISYGTEPMPQSTLELLHKAIPTARLKQTYGLSELGIMSTKSESDDSLWVKIGGDGVEIKIIDDILFVRTKSAMIGYLNAPSPFDSEGWFNTKDKVEQKDRYLKVLGRITDIINVGGEKVYPSDVESVLIKYEGVKDIRIFGESNPLVGKIVAAQVQVAAQNNNRDFVKGLRKFAVENLEKFKVPVKIILTENSLFSDRLKKKR